MNRRKFIKNTAQTAVAITLLQNIKSSPLNAAAQTTSNNQQQENIPLVISTWKHGMAANEAAWKVLSNGGRALDAVEQGVKIPEADPNVRSVGYGGRPDRDGHVTLDASIMDEHGNAGSVACLEHIMHPISVARLVMENTPHVMLVGDGALQFALENGFEKMNLLTPESEKEWREWLNKSKYTPYKQKDHENHDTIGMLAIDKSGNLSGACTTSGLSWKYHGRVGDSPIIGAGMYVDNEVGGACATGVGEAVIKICGSFLIVELMRQGMTPQKACEEAVRRISKQKIIDKDFQVAFLAVNKKAEIGAYSYAKDFSYAFYNNGKNQFLQSDYLMK